MFRTSLARTADQVRHLEEMNRVHASTIEAFASAVDAKDQVTHGHLRRVQMYSLEIAGRLGIGDPGVLRAIEAAALLHDVGKIGVPEHILNKPGRLTPAEFEEMKRHVTIGADILSTVDFPFPVVPIVRHHHENWDGTGYPDGICGTDIPIGARILMVADCFDALTSDRPYRPAMTDAAAFEILRQRRGRMYDPEIVDLFLEVQPALARAGGLARPATARSHVNVPARAEARPQRAAGEGLTTVHAEALARLLSDLLTECLIVVYEVDATATAVVAKVAQGPGARHVIGHRLPLGHGVSGWVAVNRQPIDDTDALLDLSGVAPAIETALLTCTCTPVTTAAGDVVVTVYGPRAAANQRIAAVRSINMYLAAMARAGSRHGGSSESKPMAFAS
jgi:putative nucleotidyltransferase with HDIG domain